MAEIVELLVSPVRRLDGRPAPLAEPLPAETAQSVRIRAGLGIVGDRYFNRPAHRDASVTIMTAEALDPFGVGLRGARRNILLRGVDLDGGLGHRLSLDAGDGVVVLSLAGPAHPCTWMDHTVAPGAWKALRGHGGMRCEPLSDGVLHVGPVVAAWVD